MCYHAERGNNKKLCGSLRILSGSLRNIKNVKNGGMGILLLILLTKLDLYN